MPISLPEELMQAQRRAAVEAANAYRVQFTPIDSSEWNTGMLRNVLKTEEKVTWQDKEVLQIENLLTGKATNGIQLKLTDTEQLIVSNVTRSASIVFVIDTIGATIKANKERVAHLLPQLKKLAKESGHTLKLLKLRPRGGKGKVVRYWSFGEVDDTSLLSTSPKQPHPMDGMSFDEAVHMYYPSEVIDEVVF